MAKLSVGQTVTTPKGEGVIVQTGTRVVVVKIGETTYTIKKMDCKA